MTSVRKEAAPTVAGFPALEAAVHQPDFRRVQSHLFGDPHHAGPIPVRLLRSRGTRRSQRGSEYSKGGHARPGCGTITSPESGRRRRNPPKRLDGRRRNPLPYPQSGDRSERWGRMSIFLEDSIRCFPFFSLIGRAILWQGSLSARILTGGTSGRRPGRSAGGSPFRGIFGHWMRASSSPLEGSLPRF